jgi:signal transduction histidine kinase
VKFTDKGYIQLAAEKHGTSGDAKQELIFSVRDTGIGMPDDQKALIFEAFRQQDGQSAAQYGGTGLGLAITKWVAQAHGGDLTVTSRLDRGSTFTFSLPLPKPT